MFEITCEQQQYTVYTLMDTDARSRATVVPERGGILLTWHALNQDILYLDAERFKDPSLSIRGGVPLLFPICGDLPNNTYIYKEKRYQLKQHGFARNLPWIVTEQSTDQGASLTIHLQSNETTRAIYPFDFEAHYTYTLQGNTLEIRFRHKNRSSEPLPFSTGIHPYFKVADKSQLTVDLPSNQFKAKGDTHIQTFPGRFDFEQPEIDVAFFNLSRQSVSVSDRHSHRKLTLEFDEHYSTLVFWCVKGKDFYCLEPWSGPRYAINTGESLLKVEPGATIETKIRMAVESLE